MHLCGICSQATSCFAFSKTKRRANENLEQHYNNLANMKSHPVLRYAKEAPDRKKNLSFQSKYAKLRNFEILNSNQKLVTTICRIESGKGAYNHKKIDQDLFKPRKTNKHFHESEKQKVIAKENEVFSQENGGPPPKSPFAVLDRLLEKARGKSQQADF